MPPHRMFCKSCGSLSFTILNIIENKKHLFAPSAKVKCNGCGKISYKKGRYAFNQAKRLYDQQVKENSNV